MSSHPSLIKQTVVLVAVFMAFLECVGQGEVRNDGESLETRILFVFDASNSMNAFWGNQRKITTASSLLSASLEKLGHNEHVQTGLRVYGHGTRHVPGIQNCDDTELVVPFGNQNTSAIEQALRRLRAQGTTPIARSLELAAGDFPDSPGQNVIILITDGIEACDEDPCAVSRALQAKGIVVKPFVIGMGLDRAQRESLECVGNFYDASQPESFEHILQLVLEQALHNTSVHIELMNGAGDPIITDVAYTFTDVRTSEHDPQWIHTLRLGNVPDTLNIDPLPTYNLSIHTLPGYRLDSIQLQPGVHNVIAVENMGQGRVKPQFQRGVRTPYGSLPVEWRLPGECSPFFTSVVGEEIRLRSGSYDVLFATTPPTLVENVEIREDKRDLIEIPVPGTLSLQGSTSRFAMVLVKNSLLPVIQLEPSKSNSTFTLQPGEYTLISRSQIARGTLNSIRKHFTISSGQTTYLNIHG